MYFKKLELFGFKSFADKTILNFEPGITAIVGPNGCGKSNIFDAIRWVLGEQSVKELRGSSMEDVIFNGTEKKPSLGFAEVNLTFSNDNRQLPIEQDEVMITRRLFRSGESEYLINKSVVRLKDIQELLMGTGIGAEAYSLIQQGKVDLVVSAKPEERRLILDEAAGITKYKAKKKEALNRLRDTENNLLRINDIIVEVKRQIGSIERQANKARKYKVEFEKLKDLEVKFAQYQIEGFSREEETINNHIQQLRDKETKLNQEIEENSHLLTHEINLLGEIEQKINEIKGQEIKLDGQIDLNNRQIGFNQERSESLAQNNERLIEQKQQLIERCRVQQEKIQELQDSLGTTQQALEQNRQTLEQKRSSLTELEHSIKQAKETIRAHDEKILHLTSKQVHLRNDMTDIMKEIQGAIARKRRLELENEKVSFEKREIDEKLQKVDSDINHLRQKISELSFEKQQYMVSIEDLKTQVASLEQIIDDLEKKKVFFISQKDFIEKLNTQYQDIPDPVIEGRLVTSSRPSDHHTGIVGKVKEVQPLQGEHLEYLRRTMSESMGNEFYEIICETKFIELDPHQISTKIDQIAGEIQEKMSTKENLLARLNEQRRLSDQVEQQMQQHEQSCSILEAQKLDVLAEEKKLTDELNLVEIELQDVKELLSSTRNKEQELNYQLETINQDIGWCQNDIKDKQGHIASRSQEKEDAIVAVAQLETEIASDEDKLKSHQENHKMFSDTLDSWLEEIKKIDDVILDHGQKKEQYTQEIESLNVRIEQIKLEKESLKESGIGYEAQRSDMGQRINSVRAHMTSLEEEVEQIKQSSHEVQLQMQKLGFGGKEIKDRLLQLYKIDFDEVISAAKTSEELADSSEITNVPGSPEPISEKPSKGEAPSVEMSREEMNQEIERLRKRCDSFGNVNLVAIEEYEALKERFEFLTKQQSDLIESKSQLMNTIKKINRSTRQMFMDTFTKVSEEFRIYFRMLFGGGEAKLVLLDPENVLESGIEIIAKPPGKKLQSISLLSGGEKSLTAIALIFGVFKVNPSPFCVLDEIDAALDESNVGRFGYLLKDFAKVAQFIVVTHNKKTISCSDVMYGITMPETGISRIVSVKFSDEEKKKAQEESLVGV